MPLALIVDDEPSIRALIEVTLEMEGYETVSAADGLSALELAATRHPDVVTLDIMMPDMDGWDVARSLQSSGIPIVIVSGKPLDELEHSPDRSLASAVLVKPFDFASFVAVVGEVIARSTEEIPRPR